MPVFKRPFSFLRRNVQNASGVPAAPSSALQPPTATPQQPKTLAQLEQEMAAEAQVLQPRPMRHSPRKLGRTFNKIKWTIILLGVPAGIVWFVNLPYPMIRRPVARSAPILLLPSYISMDNHYRQAIASTEQAEQLINNATSPADLDLGEQKLGQAKDSLDALPIGFLNDFPEYRYWWYDWRFSRSQFDDARRQVGQLEAKVFQERNAQAALFDAEQALNAAKQQYQQATTQVDKDLAIAAWQSALDQLVEIPSQTLAGATAQQKLVAYERDFQALVGLLAGNEQVNRMIQGARHFAGRASQAGQNPPHTVDEWQQVANLWQEAIDRLETIREDDSGYAVVQPILAEYKQNLGIIQLRQRAEYDSVQAFQEAQNQVVRLQSTAGSDDISYEVSQLQGVVYTLERVQNGTTVYLESQSLLLFAQNKLSQMQPQ